MEKINRHNYEAFFLDFAEGNLSEKQLVELNTFLDENPDLRSELDGFELVELPTEQNQTHEWNTLKKPNLEDLKKDIKLRDAFFLRAIEKQLTGIEMEMLHDLLQDEQLENEFALWQKVILLSGNEKMDKDALYQFGLDQRISENNYEYFLIALGEGLLNNEQKLALEKFAFARPMGVRELEIGRSLKLSTPKGIFYPDKKSLYKKEKAGILIWLYRVGAVAAVLLLGVFIWNQSQTENTDTIPVAQNEKSPSQPAIGPDSLIQIEIKSPDTLQKIQGSDEDEYIEPPLNEWEMREPDQANYAEATAPMEKKSTENQINIAPIPIEPVSPDNLAENIEEPALIDKPVIIDENPAFADQKQEKSSSSKTFNSVPEYAEDLMAQKLNIPDSEKDEMAMVLAKRITSKASELLDAEYTKESTGSAGDESLTYTLRIGNFKVKRVKSK